jgi:hypothetical protein
MHRSMALPAQGHQIVQLVFATLRTKLYVMRVQVITISAMSALPLVPVVACVGQCLIHTNVA